MSAFRKTPLWRALPWALAGVLPFASLGIVAHGRMIGKELKETRTMCELAEEMDATPWVRGLQDPQSVQLPAAKAKGLSAPVANRAKLASCESQLTPLVDNERYALAEMSHSVPMVTPATAALLDEIGRRFQARLAKLGLPNYRLVVTSGLRTLEDQRQLQESGNANAVRESAHFYGTTVDLAYMNWQSPSYPFDRIALASVGELSEARQCRNQVLKAVLSETLTELRKEKRAFVMHEGLRQACFHVTAR
jgi:hypothetical protein